MVKVIKEEKKVILDGYIGVDWGEVSITIFQLLRNNGLTLTIYDIKEYFKHEEEIKKLVEPFLGGEDPIFGHKSDLELSDYFDRNRLANIQSDLDSDITIIYGTGASQCNINGFLVYFDLPKNELQFRMRASEICNLGFSFTNDPKQMYKHFYFVDWVVLNKEKKRLLPEIDIIVDQQRPTNPTWTKGDALRESLNQMSTSYFRVHHGSNLVFGEGNG